MNILFHFVELSNLLQVLDKTWCWGDLATASKDLGCRGARGTGRSRGGHGRRPRHAGALVNARAVSLYPNKDFISDKFDSTRKHKYLIYYNYFDILVVYSSIYYIYTDHWYIINNPFLTSKTWALHRGKMLIGSINGGHTMLDRRLHGLIQMISDGIPQYCHRPSRFDWDCLGHRSPWRPRSKLKSADFHWCVSFCF